MHAGPSPRKTLAVFDFDGTLTVRDTSLSFLAFAAGRTRVFTALALRAPLYWLDMAHAAAMERKGRADALGSVRGRWGTLVHRRMIRALLRGRERAEIEALGRGYATELTQTDLSREGLAQVAWHRAEGHECVLVTASLAAYMEPWAASAGFDRVLATQLAFDDRGRATGGFEGEPCWGAAKLRRLRASVGPLEDRTLVVYGDGPGDRALLEQADHAVVVRGPESWKRLGAEVRSALTSR